MQLFYTVTEEVLEIWIDKTSENYAKLKLVYNDFGAPIFPYEDFESEKFDVWSIGVEPRKIEILTKVSGLHFVDSFKKCDWLDVDLFQVPYIDFEDLMRNKSATGRLKDLADIEQLQKNKNNN